MSLLELTVQPDPAVTHFRAAVELEGARYQFAFYTNAIDGGWSFDVASEDESSAATGIALVAGIDLLHPYRHLDLPPGQLFVVDRDGGDPDATAFADGRASLYYLEAST